MGRLADNTREKNVRSQSIARQLRDFINLHERQLTTHAHGMTSTTQTLKGSLEDMSKDMLSKVSVVFL